MMQMCGHGMCVYLLGLASFGVFVNHRLLGKKTVLLLCTYCAVILYAVERQISICS